MLQAFQIPEGTVMSINSLKSLFEAEAKPSPIKVGAVLAEYFQQGQRTYKDDRAVEDLLKGKGYISQWDLAQHLVPPAQGNTPQEKVASMNISAAMSSLKLGSEVPESILQSLRIS